jgi:hypothetical protein
VAKIHDNGGIIGKTVDFNDTGTYTTGNKKNSGIWNIGSAIKTEPPVSYDSLIVDYSGSEGGDMRFVLQTSNVPDGTIVTYYLSGTGITASDFTSGFDYGSATINSNQALITIGLSADALTEGTETVTITLNPTDNSGNQTGSLSANTTIADTSKTVAYQITSFSDTTPNEGTTVTVNYRVSNSMETLYWTINGTTNDFNAVNGASAFSSTTTSGNDTWYNHSITFNVNSDGTTEGNEAFTFSLRSGSTSGTVQATQAFTVQDTSKTIAYSIYSFSDTTPNEGDTVNVEMRVSNSNPTIYWSTSATTADVSASSGTATYIGTTVIGNDTYYRYTASFTITADTTTEGNEAYTFYMRTGSTSGTIQAQQSFTIIDTSLDPTSGGGTGLSDVLATYSGQYSTSLWQQVDLSSSFSQFVGSTGRLVFQYTSGTSFRGDIQLDDINIANNNYSFEVSGENWQTTTDGSTTTTYTDAFYQGLAWTSVGTGTSVNRWNRDSGGTGSSSTGLASADAGSWYLYVETSSPGYSYKVSWLRSPEIVLDNNTLNFALGRYGSNIGTLRVFWETTVPAVTDLYSFTSHTFTNAGLTGREGPTLAQLQSAYSGVTWAQDTQYFNVSTQGIQEWTVPADGTYRIQASGASGGVPYDASTRVGYGAIVTADYVFTAGETIRLVVGQQGRPVSQSNPDGPLTGSAYNSGGGGGSFVFKTISDSVPLLAAGGGGGGAYSGTSTLRANASTDLTGNPGTYVTNEGVLAVTGLISGQTLGGGGVNLNSTSYKAGGGAGWNGNGGGGHSICTAQAPYHVQGGWYRSKTLDTSSSTTNGGPFMGGWGGNNQAGNGSQQGGFGGGGGGTGRCGSCQAGGGGGYTGGGIGSSTDSSPTKESLAGGGNYVSGNTTALSQPSVSLQTSIASGYITITKL